jgi:hypothetical protein
MTAKTPRSRGARSLGIAVDGGPNAGTDCTPPFVLAFLNSSCVTWSESLGLDRRCTDDAASALSINPVHEMSMPSVTIAVLVALSLSGCGSWVRPNTSEGQRQQDYFECEQAAARMYPAPAPRPPTPTPTTLKTNCTTSGRDTSCTTTQVLGATDYYSRGQDAGAAVAATIADSSQSSARISCMRGKGYSIK